MRGDGKVSQAVSLNAAILKLSKVFGNYILVVMTGIAITDIGVIVREMSFSGLIILVLLVTMVGAISIRHTVILYNTNY